MRARVVATLMLKQQVGIIINSLVDDGYTVQPNLAGNAPFRTERGNTCGVMALIVSKENTKWSRAVEDIAKAMKKVKHYSYFAFDVDGGDWVAIVGNFLMPEEEDRRKREQHAEKLL